MTRFALVVAIAALTLTLPAAAQNLLTNGTFDHDLSGWTYDGSTTGNGTWSGQDANGSSSSGSLEVSITGPSANEPLASEGQCVPVTAGQFYSLTGQVLVPTGQSAPGYANLYIYWINGPCGSGTTIAQSNGNQLSGASSWQNANSTFHAPAGVQAAWVFASVVKTGGGNSTSLSAYWDDVSFGPVTGTCTADATHLCLTGNRFRVSVQWTDYNTNVTAAATAVPFRDESGFFYFQDPANIEIMVKVHDACPSFGHFWFFSAATTNVGYTITVTDTETGQTETYSNPAHVLSAANTDQSSFASCP